MSRGYFAIGVEGGKTKANLGTLWRSANLFDAAYIFTIAHRYHHQSSDTMKTPNHVPLFHYENVEHFLGNLPDNADVVGVEMHPRSRHLHETHHSERAIYLLGAEDRGLSEEAIGACDRLVVLPGDRSMNVAVAGSIVMYDRYSRRIREGGE